MGATDDGVGEAVVEVDAHGERITPQPFHAGGQVAVQRREPQAVIRQLRVLIRHELVEPERVLGQRQTLERAMRGVQDGRGGRLVDLAALDPN